MTELRTGDVVRMRTAGETLRVGELIAEGGEGAVLRADLNGQPFALKWFTPSANRRLNKRRADGLTRLVERGKPGSSAFIWPIDMAGSDSHSGFGYVMPMMESRFTSFAKILKAGTEPPGFRILITIGLNLVDAFAALHTTGLCYRDISFGNVYVDTESGDIAVIDNDNVGPSGGDSLVRGTGTFMAPEVIRGEMLPSTETDLYSLAVFLFHLLCFGHPLDGAKVDASYSWEDGRRMSEQEVLLKHFGQDPVFVFDPADTANRPIEGNSVRDWWPVYPKFFRTLFIRSFTTGLADPSLTGRLTEGVWRKGLYRLEDCLNLCASCGSPLFFDPDDAGHACWACGTVPPPPLLLTTPGHALVLTDGSVLTGRHLKLAGHTHQPLAKAEVDPRYPGEVLLRNLTAETWTVRPAGEEAKPVKPRQRLRARPMIIELSGREAAIERAFGTGAGQ